MIKVYFDMDGVLTDLDGMLSQKSGVPRSDLKDPVKWGEAYQKSFDEGQHGHWRDIPPNRLTEFKNIMRGCQLKGDVVEILTSYGETTRSDCGTQAHAGKVRWLTEHYREEFQDRVISCFNGVQSYTQKAFYATPHSLLVDDQERNVDAFRAAGGIAIKYDLLSHQAFVEELEVTLERMRRCAA